MPVLPFRKSNPALMAAILLCAAILPLSGCAHYTPPSAKPLRQTLLVMDFSVPQYYRNDLTRVQKAGWWFLARKQYNDPNAGQVMADALTRELRMQAGDYINLLDRLRLRQYFARKQHDLEQAFPGEDPAALEQMMTQIPPEAFGRDLGADKVIVGHITESYLMENNFTRYWHARVGVQASMIDVPTGKVVWTYNDHEGDTLSSDVSVIEKIARRMVRRMQEEYFFRQAAR